jgi:hypothetical protein
LVFVLLIILGISSPGFVPVPVYAITGEDIEDGSVATVDLDNGAITAPKLSNGAVTTPKLRNGAVTESKLAPAVLDRITALEAASLEIVDAQNARVGAVMGIQGQFPTVLFRVNNRLFPLLVGQEHLTGTGPLLFQTTNCSGTPFLQDAGVLPNGIVPLLLPPVAVVPPGSRVFLPTVGSSSQSINVQSVRYTIGSCQRLPQATPVAAFPAAVVMNLDTQFTPPFRIR